MTTNWALVALVGFVWTLGLFTGMYYAAKHEIGRDDTDELKSLF